MTKKIKKTYTWYYDKKIIGVVLIAIAVSFQIFAFLKIHFLSSIHGYTIGMMLGFYNPFFYIFMIYVGINIVSENNFKLPKWFKLNSFSYWIVVFSVVFISVASSHYQSETGYTAIGKQTWKSFNKWYQDFTDNKNAWFPVNTNGGIIGVFMYSFFAMLISGIGAFILSIGMIFIIISYIITGSSIGLYKWLKASKIKKKKSISLDQKMIDTQQQNNVDDKKIISKIDMESKNDNQNDSNLPFDDPF